MTNTHRNRISYRKLIFGLLMALALVAATFPQPAFAQAVTCRTYYIVKEGDTTPYIAHTFGLKWIQIAAANKLEKGEKPAVGARLCIPPEDFKADTTGGTRNTRDDDDDRPSNRRRNVPESDPRAQISASASGGRIHITLARFEEDHEYRVKVRDASVGVGGWKTLGRITVDDDDRQTYSYDIPDELEDVLYLSVCLKDQRTDELICRVVLNT